MKYYVKLSVMYYASEKFTHNSNIEERSDYYFLVTTPFLYIYSLELLLKTVFHSV